MRGIALFMDDNSGTLGISFCRVAQKRVAISPGLSSLLNGSTYKTTLKSKTYDALPEANIGDHPCRLVRWKTKTIALFEWREKSPFAQAGSVLSKMGETGEGDRNSCRNIHVDAMTIESEAGEVADNLGCLKASSRHEVIVYEDRGQNLDFLRNTKTAATKTADSVQTGSERLQQRHEDEKMADKEKSKSSERASEEEGARGLIQTFLHSIGSAIRQKRPNLAAAARQEAATATFLAAAPAVPWLPRVNRTRADKGQVSPPNLIQAENIRDHWKNAFLEFQATVRGNREVNLATCNNILQSFRRDESLLKVRLEEAEAAIYNNDTGEVLAGKMSGQYMYTYELQSRWSTAPCGPVAGWGSLVVLRR